MTEEEVLGLLNTVGAVMEGHFVYTSGLHGKFYVNKDAVYPHVNKLARLCWSMSEIFSGDNVEAVVGPALGGIALSQKIASQLTTMNGFDVLSLFAEYELTSTGKVLVMKRGYDKLVSGKRVLVVEDILNTGGSARATVKVVRECGGIVVGVSALCNRGGVTAETLSVPWLESLVNIKMETWAEHDCPMCAEKVPVRTDVGKGKEFLARKNAT